MINSIEKSISAGIFIAGFIPVISTVTGLSWVIYGIGIVIFNDCKMTYAEDKTVLMKFQEQKDLGKIYIKGGLIEAIPFGKAVLSAIVYYIFCIIIPVRIIEGLSKLFGSPANDVDYKDIWYLVDLITKDGKSLQELPLDIDGSTRASTKKVLSS